MMVASRLPSLYALIWLTKYSLFTPANPGTAPPLLWPLVPWQAAQVAARDRTPFGVRLEAAKAGGGGAAAGAAGACENTGAAVAAKLTDKKVRRTQFMLAS